MDFKTNGTYLTKEELMNECEKPSRNSTQFTFYDQVSYRNICYTKEIDTSDYKNEIQVKDLENGKAIEDCVLWLTVVA